MILLVPYATDAPVYHWPYATVVTIVVNVLIHLFTFPMMLLAEEGSSFEAIVNFLILQFTQVNPLQWLTYYYMHADPLHLIGNMIFLWTFGLIVEGKVGWWRFLLLYNAMGLVEGAVIQVVGFLFIGHDGALGASGAIYGLLAISLIWAPFNEMQVFYWIFRWFGSLEGSVATVCGFFIGTQLLTQMIYLMHAVNGEMGTEAVIITSEVGHLIGAFLGAFLGVAMLKLRWVECEDFDIFSVIAGRHTMTELEKKAEFAASEEGKALRAQQLQAAYTEFRHYLAQNQPLAALATHRRAKNQFPEWAIPEPEFVQLIALLRKLHLYNQAVPTMLDYLRTYRDRAVAVRLALAQILTDHTQRPGQALAVLAKLNGTPLDAQQRKAFDAVYAKAQAAYAEDPYEVAPEDW